jgi:DNA (cytosine-5)-methyltransferase 1
MGGGLNGQDAYSGRIMAVANAIPIHDQATRFSGKRGGKQDGKGNGLGVGKPGDPCPTLTKGDKHAVLYENHPNDSRVTGPHDVAPSCVSRYGTGGGNVPLVQEAIIFQTSELRLTGKITEQTVCPTLKANTKAGDTEPKVIAFEPGIATREGSESRFVKELSPTLRKEMGDNQVAVAVDCYNKTIGEKSQSISSSASDINHTGGVINPADRMAVRRLTPRECERLQGFPDDHTLISWRNKPADECPDGPRYKALGNSMAVPCMAWIGKRIDAVEKTK